MAQETSPAAYFKVKSALQLKIGKYNFKFYNVANFNDSEELNSKVLPEIIKIAHKGDLNYYGETLSANFENLFIDNLISIEETQLQVNMKYFEESFALILPLDNEITDFDVINSIDDFFQTNSQIKKIIVFSWSKPVHIFDKSKHLIKKTIKINTDKFKVNNRKTEIKIEKLNFMSLDMTNIKDKQTIAIIFNYNETDLMKLIQLKTSKLIDHEHLKNDIMLEIWSNGIEFLLPKGINYKNFWEKSPFDQWLLQVKNLFKNKTIKVEYSLDLIIDHNLIEFVYVKEELTKYTENVLLTLSCVIDSQKVLFDIFIHLGEFDNEKEVVDNFKAALQDLKIDAQNFNKIDIHTINSTIEQTIIKTLNHHFTKIEHFKNWNELKLLFYKIILTNNNEFKLKIAVESEYLDSPFNIEIKLINSNYWVVNLLETYLEQFNSINAFDLKSQISADNTWIDVIDKIKSAMQLDNFDKNIVNQIIWKDKGDKALINALINDWNQGTEVNKEVRLSFNEIELKLIDFHLKNLKIENLSQLEIQKVCQDFSKNQKTTMTDVMPHWNINDHPSKEELGIEEPKNKRRALILYKISGVNVNEGTIKVSVNVIKYSNSETLDGLIVTGFQTNIKIIEKINAYFNKKFTYQENQFTMKNTYREAFALAYKLTEKLIGSKNMQMTIFSLKSHNTEFNENLPFKSGEILRIRISINNKFTEFDFELQNI